MPQATLRTDRIVLQALSDEHLEHEIELDSDPEVMRYLGPGRARSRDEVIAVHRLRLDAAGSVSGPGFWCGDDLGLERIFAETMAVNAASRATMSAVGLVHVRSFHEHWDEPLAGAELGEVEYSITRQEWSVAR